MVDIDELAARAVADPPADLLSLLELTARASRRRQRRRRRVGLAAALVVVAGLAGALAVDRSGSGTDPDGDASVIANGSDVPAPADVPIASDDRVALDALLDGPAAPEDEFPDDFFTQWDWEPDLENSPMDARLDFAASRSVTVSEDLPAFAVPTYNRDGVCLVLTYPPPDWWPELDSFFPFGCADAATFNDRGITMRNCGPGDRWVTMSLVPIGVDPADVAPYGELDRSGTAVLFDRPPAEPVDLRYATGHTIRLKVYPFGQQPGDGSVPCPAF